MSPISRTSAELPEPAPDALAHSRRVAGHIREAIQAAGGAIPFSRYMDLALYAPGLGYYSAGARKFGAAGDFITAPELSPLFSRCLARQCAEVLAEVKQASILELGAGSGVMAADMLLELQALGRLPAEYLILEVSGELRERQRQTLAAKATALASRVRWLDALPERFSGVIVGNEVLDALPVERFLKRPGGFDEYCVRAEGESLAWSTRAAGEQLAATLAAFETTLPEPLKPGYVSEFNLGLMPLVSSLAATLKQGALLLLDYGYPRAAYYHHERSMGTLMCHYRQRAHDDPFLYPGLQDITAHVDFTAVAEAGTSSGLDLAGYTTQAHFLMALGVAGLAGADMRAAQQVKLLTLPEEMGERFKAIGFSKGIETALSGFTLRDLSRQL
ncbi:MAG TPA: SAM-dependent methyltransferase [Gammaproteobacteria bacterium]|nr:SAM-dependent methyltransferase [Gammaproteobacteria bacterium]